MNDQVSTHGDLRAVIRNGPDPDLRKCPSLLPRLVAGIRRGAGHSVACATGAEAAAATVLRWSADGVQGLREAGVKAVSVESVARGGCAEPLLVDAEVLQLLAAQLYPRGGDALQVNAAITLSRRDRLRVLLGGQIHVSTRQRSWNLLELDGPVEVKASASEPGWLPWFLRRDRPVVERAGRAGGAHEPDVDRAADRGGR